MDAINEQLAADLAAADLADEHWSAEMLAGLQDLVDDTDKEVTKMRDFHSKALGTYSRRVDNARKLCRNELTELDDEKHRLQQKFDADLRRLDAERRAIEQAAEKEIETARKLASASRTALEALAS